MNDFYFDTEKMRDFHYLTKEEFLDSYSYLTETEYNLTRAKYVSEAEKMYIDEENTWRMPCGCTEANVLDGVHNKCNARNNG